jgi:hypothetical protein
MAIALKQLGDLSIEDQESILDGMLHEYFPIEINGKKFMIPKEVNILVDELYLEVKRLDSILEGYNIGEERD